MSGFGSQNSGNWSQYSGRAGMADGKISQRNKFAGCGQGKSSKVPGGDSRESGK